MRRYACKLSFPIIAITKKEVTNQVVNKITFGCLPADPALEICKIARHHKSDLIILGSHQESEKMCLGRVDYVGMTILEKASCPVMLVPS